MKAVSLASERVGTKKVKEVLKRYVSGDKRSASVNAIPAEKRMEFFQEVNMMMEPIPAEETPVEETPADPAPRQSRRS